MSAMGALSTHAFAYASNNPQNFVDATGLAPTRAEDDANADALDEAVKKVKKDKIAGKDWEEIPSDWVLKSGDTGKDWAVTNPSKKTITVDVNKIGKTTADERTVDDVLVHETVHTTSANQAMSGAGKEPDAYTKQIEYRVRTGVGVGPRFFRTTGKLNANEEMIRNTVNKNNFVYGKK